MIELPLIFVAGILGTAHCLGMCGPLALRLSTQSTGWSRAVARQGLYSLGRIFSYTFLGALAGFCGQWAARNSAALINVPAVFAILAGIVLIYQGLLETGIIGMLRTGLRPCGAGVAEAPASSATCGLELLYAPFFRGQGMTGAMLAGICTGFLPCGLLYGMLTLAASTQQVALGGLTMLVFGLGTTPLLMLAGVSGQFLTLASRRRLLTAAAWCLLLTGCISIVRGASHFSWGEAPAAGCPLCSPSDP